MLEQINDILMDMAFLDDPPSLEDKLKDDLGIDSLKLVELIINLEECFDITIEENDLNPQNINTVGDIVNLASRYTGGQL
ncbi:MAG: acyl carrier protein [Clostridiales bacterium]|nr:acyl carrier protein [Clostridiales bacterium]